MSEVTYRGQTVDYLGFLRTQLNGLQGISTLCYELIQNADDVKNSDGSPGASRITFDICDDALWVANDGVFREVDFERMQRIAWGNKREEEGTTGAFGIGFISVYQITDSPEIYSSGRHWIFRPDDEETKRIAEETAKTEFTRFRLPWALEYSRIREELGISPVKKEDLKQYEQEILRSVRNACLFLKQIRSLEVKSFGELICCIETSQDQNQVLVQDGENLNIWTTFKGDFSAQADRLRQQYVNLIETKRHATVQVIIPDHTDLEGLLYAFLPSEQATGFPFHINADFYTTPDRKRILFDSSYKGEWNRAAIACAIDIVAQHIQEILDLLKPVKFWRFLDRIKKASDQYSVDSIFNDFWRQIKGKLIGIPCVITQSGETKRPSATKFPVTENQAKCSTIFGELSLPIVIPELRSYQNLLLECGSDRLQISDIINAFHQKGFIRRLLLQEMPQTLQSIDGWHNLWEVLNEPDEKSNNEGLSKISIAFGNDGALWPPRELIQGDDETKKLFSQIAPDQIWFDSRDYKGSIPQNLVVEFTVEKAVALIGENLSQISKLWAEKKYPIKELYAWFEKQNKHLTSELKQNLRDYPIWPTQDGSLQPLNGLFLTGDFEDPLKMAQFVNVKALGDKREFLEHDLNVKILDFVTYVNDYLPSAFLSGKLDCEKKLGVLDVLAKNLGKMQGQISQYVLLELPLVWCGEDKFLPARETYFPDNILKQLLGDEIHFAQFPKTQEEAIRALYEWLGVASEPRSQDIIERILFLVSEPPDPERIQNIQKIFEFIATRWQGWEEKQKEFGRLREIAWLPGTRSPSQWFKPSEVYAIYQSYLFESQGNFLTFSRNVQNRASSFIKFLGIKSEPSVKQVVGHLLDASNKEREINQEVYTLLNQNADAPEIETLRCKKCIYLSTGKYIRPQDAFWEEHHFGKYRYQLNTDFRPFQKLLDRLGVKTNPDGQDAIEVLLEISIEFGSSNLKLNDETKNIVIHCWTLLSKALEERKIGKEIIKKQLKEIKSILDPRKILVAPKNVLIEDRPELGKKFQLIKNNLIEPIQGAWMAMEAAGAQKLSRIVQKELIQCENQQAASEAEQVIKERSPLIRRIAEANKAKGIKGINLDSLDNLHITQADSIQIRLFISLFGKKESKIETVDAIQIDENLYYSNKNGAIPWSDIAREVSYLIYTEGDLPNLALELKEVLSSSSTLEANQTLDHLGYPRYQESVHPTPTSPIATPGGSTVGSENPPLPEKGEGQSQDQYGSEDESASVDQLGEGEHPPKRRKTRLVSYVYPEEQETLEEETSRNTQLIQEIARIGVEKVMEYERKQGRNPTDMNAYQPNYPGYDIESVDASGNKRYIEVKSLSDRWDSANPVQLTRKEFETARNFQDEFWLYIVEYVSDSNQMKIYAIQNPAGKINYYLFDHGWMEIAVGD